LAGCANASERYLGRHVVERLPRGRLVRKETLQAFGGDGAGADDVDADAPALEISDPVAGKAADGGLGRSIDAAPLVALVGIDRGQQDDRAARTHEIERTLNGEHQPL